ncbi:MAG TPA: virulence factor SrfC family protein [Candidatus Competibacteraceae bacterium]|nr:TerD family protein [Candidatus Competibacteraceae bacterium]MCP5132231.1 TerD family protein [Gammaproteobacteria bacterium]HRY17675.1 virulence factor SrfC family protein [Candidatus Competibacteraceae bacterium]
MLTFQAGQNLSLSQQNPGIQHVELNLSWEPADGPQILDASAFALTEQGTVRDDGDFIFYNQPVLAGNGITLQDNGQQFAICLADLPAAIARIAITVALDAGEGQSMAILRQIRLELRNGSNGTGIASFTLDTTGMIETAIILGELYRRRSEWKFRAVGQGFAGGLAALARHFGVDVSDEAEPASPQPSPMLEEAVPSASPVSESGSTVPPSSSPPSPGEGASPALKIESPDPAPLSGGVLGGRDAASSDQLSARCRELEHVGTGFLNWLTEHHERVGQEKAGLTKEFRRLVAQARRLNQAVQRPMCAGVFGPSQSGKSYLISALARKGNAPLLADFAGQKIDFIRDLNPEGGRESTGLVTRFTLQTIPGVTPAAPVQMRLLTQTDLVKMLGNTYYADCDHSDDEPLSQTRLNELLTGLVSFAQTSPVDPLTAEDVFDLQAYFERYFKGQERVRLLRHGYWEQAAQLAPRLRIQDRARLFGIIWGDVDAFSQLYIRLYNGLQGLNFATDAQAGLEALIPREQSIIDVQTLKSLGTGSGGTLTLTGTNGARVTLPRSEVAALIAELRIVISEQPWDFFQHTDLLDFPGARSREQIKDLPAFLQGNDALQSLFLRGKVAYLFERYCAEQELTSMLLCIGPSNQEVKTLPEMVYDWVISTHGATPEQRTQQPTALFLVLTKFDMEFEEKAGERSPEGRWTTRLESSLLNFFGKQHEWPRQWDVQGCFRNSYWLRNPNFKAKHMFDYDESGRELGIRPGEKSRIEMFRTAFLRDQNANRHFRNPTEAWDAGFTLNDGGVTYLAQSLRPLCNPELKRQQLTGQTLQLREQMAERIGHYHVSDNPEQELEKRLEAARQVAARLIDCAGEQRFGELLRSLQTDSDDLESIYYRIETRLPDETQAAGAPTIGTAVDTQKMKVLLGLSTSGDKTQEETRKDDAALFAREVVAEWMRDLQDLSGDKSRCDYYRVPEALMAEFVKELISGAQRLKLEDQIVAQTRRVTGFRMKFEQIVTLPARLTANLLNRYVDFLGYDALALDKRPLLSLENGPRPVFPPRAVPQGGPQLSERQSTYDQDYYTDWIRAYLDLVERNARFHDGAEVDLAANRHLGALLTQLHSAAA